MWFDWYTNQIHRSSKFSSNPTVNDQVLTRGRLAEVIRQPWPAVATRFSLPRLLLGDEEPNIRKRKFVGNVCCNPIKRLQTFSAAPTSCLEPANAEMTVEVRSWWQPLVKNPFASSVARQQSEEPSRLLPGRSQDHSEITKRLGLITLTRKKLAAPKRRAASLGPLLRHVRHSLPAR